MPNQKNNKKVISVQGWIITSQQEVYRMNNSKIPILLLKKKKYICSRLIKSYHEMLCVSMNYRKYFLSGWVFPIRLSDKTKIWINIRVWRSKSTTKRFHSPLQTNHTYMYRIARIAFEQPTNALNKAIIKLIWFLSYQNSVCVFCKAWTTTQRQTGELAHRRESR